MNMWESKRYLNCVHYGEIRQTEVSDCFTLCIFLDIANRIIWQIFPETLNSHQYVTHILTPLWNTCPITGKPHPLPSRLPARRCNILHPIPFCALYTDLLGQDNKQGSVVSVFAGSEPVRF